MTLPIYLLAGGPGQARKGPDPILAEVFALAGRAAPTIAYIGSASDDDAGFLKWLTALFRAAGSGAVRLAPTAGRHADLDEARRVLETADLIYVSGGDVEAGMALLHRLRLDALLRRLYRAGRPFFGLSAGSIMLARAWVRWSDPDDDTTAEEFSCLGFARVLCDCHAEADAWEELHALLRLQPGPSTGYGIPSGAALRVDADGSVRALGKPVLRFVHRNGRTALRGLLRPS